MALTINGIPEWITRDDYLSLIRALGMDPMRLSRLELAPSGVYATVKGMVSDGGDVLGPIERNQTALHRIFIPIRD